MKISEFVIKNTITLFGKNHFNRFKRMDGTAARKEVNADLPFFDKYRGFLIDEWGCLKKNIIFPNLFF